MRTLPKAADFGMRMKSLRTLLFLVILSPIAQAVPPAVINRAPTGNVEEPQFATLNSSKNRRHAIRKTPIAFVMGILGQAARAGCRKLVIFRC